jgi:hypothetical protein
MLYGAIKIKVECQDIVNDLFPKVVFEDYLSVHIILRDEDMIIRLKMKV